MLSASNTQSAHTNRSGPIRLRQACNNCCAAKVKCSGEKTGCQRCRNSNVHCLYQESRVGKVKGNRRRKHSQPLVTRPLDNRPSFAAVQQTVSPSQNSSTPLDAEHDNLLSWPNDIQIPSSAADYLNDSGTTAIDFNIDELLRMAPETETEDIADVSTSTAHLRMPLSLGLRPRNEQDSQCIIECTRIISDVENYIMSGLKSFKILLGIVRKALNLLKGLIQLQQSSPNLRCLFLFFTILYQVLEVLETCFANAKKEFSSVHHDASTIGSPLGVRGIGVFGIDPEEQTEWRLQMILKEANYTFELLKELKSLAGIGPSHNELQRDEVSGSPESCYIDLQLRLQDLSTRISSFG